MDGIYDKISFVNGDKMEDDHKINVDIIKNIEKIKDKMLASKLEKNYFLGEYKERVMVALTFDEVEEKGIYNEISQALEKGEAKKMIISREVAFDSIKKYINIAKNRHIPYKMIDNLLNTGNIGLVVVSDNALRFPPENPVVESKREKIEGKHLPLVYYEALGNKICKFHMEIIQIEIPEYKQYYTEIKFMDSFFGTTCPICKKLGGKKRG